MSLKLAAFGSDLIFPNWTVVMRMGGASTAGWRSNVEINKEDLRVLHNHGIWSCLPLIYLTYLLWMPLPQSTIHLTQ